MIAANAKNRRLRMPGNKNTGSPLPERCGSASPYAPGPRHGRASMDDWSSVKLCDVGNLLLGMILFFSPWLFGLSTGAQWQTASTVGILIAVLSVAALAAFAIWEEKPDRRAVAHRLALASGFPGQQRDGRRRVDRRRGGGIGRARSVADSRHAAAPVRKPRDGSALVGAVPATKRSPTVRLERPRLS
jgi:hypothetical protein